MTNSQSNKQQKPNCFSKWIMRFKRARHMMKEDSAQSVSVRIFSVFAILLGIAPPIGRAPEPKPPRRGPLKTIPVEYRIMSFQDAVRHLRSPTRANKKVIEAAERLKVYAPLASDFIDHCITIADWSELSRCLNADNEEQTIMKLNMATQAWSSSNDDDHSPAPTGMELLR